jgi:ATP-dependent DNA ligase
LDTPLSPDCVGGGNAAGTVLSNDDEAVACDGDGLPVFDRLRYRRQYGRVFLYAFDLLELNGRDMRREPLDVRKSA